MTHIPSEIIDVFNHLPDQLIATVHKDPDVDAIGSLLAFQRLINGLGKQITLYVPDFNPALFAYLPGVDTIAKDAEAAYHMAFFLDCSDHSRIVKPQAFPNATTIVNIDHHQDNTNFGHHNWVANASSVGEMLYHLFQALNQPMSSQTATLLYSAICFDTGNFKFANTTRDTFIAAADLIQKGIKASYISECIFEQKTKKYFEDVRMGLNNMYIDREHPFMIVHIPNHPQMSGESTINFFRQLEQMELVIVCKEVKKRQYRLSFRSKQQVNVAKIASQFDGGGHIRAAGATAEASFEELQAALIEYCTEAFQ
jgi:phosphoesterase RecJ-like protein